MFQWIVVAGCAGGVAGFAFGVAIERARVFWKQHTAELHAAELRRTVAHERAALTPAVVPARAYANGDASLHA